MFQKKKKNIITYHFENLTDSRNIIHFITTRQGGVSKTPYESLNLSYLTKDPAENIRANRAGIAGMLNIKAETLIFPKQTHSSNIKIIDHNFLTLNEPEREIQLSDIDAMVTKEKGVCICVLTADCVPVILHDPVAKAIAVIHAGWRGTAGQIVSKTIRVLMEKFQSCPENILAGIGPSIGPDAYEVGEDVAEIFIKLYGKNPIVVINKVSSGEIFLNLWEANRLELIQSGVPGKNIEVAALCTYLHDDVFFSSRKSGGVTGRFANGIMLL